MDVWGKYDRKFSIVDVETHALITARQVPKVRWFHIQISDGAGTRLCYCR